MYDNDMLYMPFVATIILYYIYIYVALCRVCFRRRMLFATPWGASQLRTGSVLPKAAVPGSRGAAEASPLRCLRRTFDILLSYFIP